MQELAEAWCRRLEKDLAGFSDPGSSPVVEREGTTLRTEWISQGHERSDMFGLRPDGVLRWLSGPTGDDSYGAYLTSDSMAYFAQLARAIANTIERRDDFIPNEAVVDKGFETRELSATPENLASLADESRKQAEGRTGLLFLKGDPGAGKTTALRELTSSQAQMYLDGKADFLFFYVSAQGRELSNLRDAFSGELDDLRAAFTRDAIPALVRAGLLIPVVDGFDELLGTAGYSGAFSSLQSLLSDLEGLGAVVVSARSAFYDLEFLGRSTSPANHADISITTISVEPWSDEQLESYLAAQGTGDVGDVLERLDPEDRALLRRPFFASEFPKFAQQARESDDKLDLLEYLIAAYLEREAQKIVDSNGDPVLPVDGHRRLFELAAAEMWESEVRQLPADDLRTLTDLIAEEFSLGPDQAAQLLTKITSYAGFRPGASGSRVSFSFEHEIYFDYFLSKSIARAITANRPAELEFILDRGIVPTTVAVNAIRQAQVEDSLLDSICTCSAGLRYENQRRNKGSLLATLARELGPIADKRVSGLAFTDLAMGSATFERTVFNNCTFLGVDFSGTVFEDCEAGRGTSFHAIRLDNRTRIDIRGLRPGHNVGTVSHPATGGDVYAPQEVQKILTLRGAPDERETTEIPSYSARADVLIKLLHHAARAYRRTTILYESDERLRHIFGNRYWPELKKMLKRHGIVAEEARQASGPRTTALRLKVGVDQLLTGQTAVELPEGHIADLWHELRNLQ